MSITTVTVSNLDDILRAIDKLEDPNEIEVVIEVAHDRRKSLRRLVAAKQFAALKVGDRVTIADDVRPKYLAGKPGTVTGKRQTKVTIDLDQPAGKYHKGIICPADMLNLG